MFFITLYFGKGVGVLPELEPEIHTQTIQNVVDAPIYVVVLFCFI